MVRKKSGVDNPGIDDDVEPVWVSADTAEDDWDDDFSSAPSKDFDRTAVEVELDDDFDQPVPKAKAPSEPSKTSARKSVTNDGFDDDFDSDFEVDGGLQEQDDEDDLEIDGDSPEPKQKSAKVGLPTSKLIPYAAMGLFGLLIVYFGYGMVFGGNKNNASPQPTETIASEQPVTQQPSVPALNPVNLQANNTNTPSEMPTLGNVAPIGAPNGVSNQSSQNTGIVTTPIGAEAPSANINDLASLAPQTQSTNTNNLSQAGVVQMPTGIDTGGGAMVMNGGVPTLPIAADPPSQEKQSSGNVISEEQLKQFGDRMVSQLQSDMNSFKSDMTQNVKAAIDDDMTIIRAQVEGLSRRIDAVEDGRGVTPLQQLVPPQPPEQPQAAANLTPPQPQEATVDPSSLMTPDVKQLVMADPAKPSTDKDIMGDGNVSPKAANDKIISSDRDNSALKPIEPIKLGKAEKVVSKKDKPTPVKKSNGSKTKKSMEPKQKPEPFMAQGLPAVGSSTRNLAASPFQKMARAEPSGLYQIRGVSAGTAWVAAPNSASIMTVSRGDFLPGLGRVTEIRRGFSGWEVITEKGMVRE